MATKNFQNYTYATTIGEDELAAGYKLLGPQSIPPRYLRKEKLGKDLNEANRYIMREVKPSDFTTAAEFMRRFETDAQAGLTYAALALTLKMQNLAGEPTIGYPVGVFNINKSLIGQATDDATYVALWNSDVYNQTVGVLSTTATAMSFLLTLLPATIGTEQRLIGCRFYTMSVRDNVYLGCNKGDYVDWGDGNKGSVMNWLKATPSNTAPGAFVYAADNEANWTNRKGTADEATAAVTNYTDERQHITIFKNVGSGAAVNTVLYHSEYGPVALHSQPLSLYNLTTVAPMSFYKVTGNFPQYCDAFGFAMANPLASFPGGFGPAGSRYLLGTITSGSGYTNGTYNNVSLSGGSGAGAKANMIVGTKILTFGTLTGGSGYAPGTYNNVPLTTVTGTGSGAVANLSISTAAGVFGITLVNGGTGYAVGNSLSAAAANIGGTGSGFSVLVGTVQAGAVTSVVITQAGTGYVAGDVLSAAAANLGGAGAGFSVPIASMSVGTNFPSLQNIKVFVPASYGATTDSMRSTLFPDITNLKKSCVAFDGRNDFDGLDGWEFGSTWTALRFFKMEGGNNGEPFNPVSWPPLMDDLFHTTNTFSAAKADLVFQLCDRDIRVRATGRHQLYATASAATAASLAARTSLIAKGWTLL